VVLSRRNGSPALSIKKVYSLISKKKGREAVVSLTGSCGDGEIERERGRIKIVVFYKKF